MWKIVEAMRATTEIHLLSGIYGLALAFFGGYFAVTIAAIEAWKMSGWETTSKVCVFARGLFRVVRPRCDTCTVNIAFSILVGRVRGAGGLYVCAYAFLFGRMFISPQHPQALGDLHANYCLALVAHNKDNKIDADHDGIADVDQISKQELVQRKLLVFAKAIDPEICSSAFSGLWTAWLSVLTTLKFRYAKTVALG
jgi:hypothetical protein